MNNVGHTVAAVLMGIIGLAIVAVIFSKNAQTPQVFQAFGSAFGQLIGSAVSPVTGAQSAPFGNSPTSFPTQGA